MEDDNKQGASRPRYRFESYTTSSRDDNASFTVRRNGKAFYIDVLPSQFVNSPVTKDKYMSYLEVLQSDEDVIGDIYETDVIDWVLEPFEPFFAELAPSPAPGSFKVTTLRDYLVPEFFHFALDIVDEELRPRQIKGKPSPYLPSGVWLDDELLDDVETWTHFYDPANIVLSFDQPEDALFKLPRKVLIDNGQTTCFFKECYSPAQTKNELLAYKKINAANLDPELHICHFYGAVMNDQGSIAGLLLSYIDCGSQTMWSRVGADEPSASIRGRWVNQLDASIIALHKIDVIWGDVKAENVLIDQDDNAWITDFGGGYTEGWVKKEVAGTVEGDLAGMAKLRKFIVEGE